MSLLTWRWPHPAEPGHDDVNVPTTLVVFELEDVAEGTQLTVVESGFDQLPLDRRAAAHRENTGGWEIQMEAIARHVTGAA